ncbi:hypothetical protein EG68_09462 [Paragonimus skrjabini miyazakii]|uniref:Uncharacterized protein n=1 Tax=Paragonimus skrjabini miyazakii TaxID=59628 RepID=A0A8S9YI97_9TREM|nr:hypothetical protein EG68_09462 [Paragonimus skrjabini miyazakii]
MEPRLIRTKTYGNLTNQLTGTRETKIKRQRTKSMEFRWLPEIDIALDEPIDFSKRYNMEDEGREASCIVADNGIEISQGNHTLECDYHEEEDQQSSHCEKFQQLPPILITLDKETCSVPDMRTVGTDTEELDLQAQLRNNRMKHHIEAVQYRLEIAEAQALIFHLSEQMHLSTENKTGPDSNCGTTDPNLGRSNSPTNEKQAETDQPTNEQYLNYPALSRASKPDAPSDLNAMLISADDRWFITWTPPDLNEMTENKGIRIDGYRVSD